MACLRPSLFVPRNLSSASRRAFSASCPSRLSKISLIGRLAADPELVPTSTGKDMIRYAIGTNYGTREDQQTSWWKIANFAEEGPARDRILGLTKGTLVYLEGDCSMRKFETKEGETETALSIVQRKLDVLSRPNRGESSEGSSS